MLPNMTFLPIPFGIIDAYIAQFDIAELSLSIAYDDYDHICLFCYI